LPTIFSTAFFGSDGQADIKVSLANPRRPKQYDVLLALQEAQLGEKKSNATSGGSMEYKASKLP
jgi:hypothetical protein